MSKSSRGVLDYQAVKSASIVHKYNDLTKETNSFVRVVLTSGYTYNIFKAKTMVNKGIAQ